jgi:hypothetical protein
MAAICNDQYEPLIRREVFGWLGDWTFSQSHKSNLITSELHRGCLWSPFIWTHDSPFVANANLFVLHVRLSALSDSESGLKRNFANARISSAKDFKGPMAFGILLNVGTNTTQIPHVFCENRSTCHIGSWGNSVSIVSGYCLGDRRSILGSSKEFFLCLSRPALRPTQPRILWAHGFFPGVKRDWIVTTHCHQVLRSRIRRNCTSSPPCRLHGVVG